jgi:hypothetical protein
MPVAPSTAENGTYSKQNFSVSTHHIPGPHSESSPRESGDASSETNSDSSDDNRKSADVATAQPGELLA